MEAGLARLARQPGKRDEFLLCLYEKISSRLPGQFCCFDVIYEQRERVFHRDIQTRENNV